MCPIDEQLFFDGLFVHVSVSCRFHWCSLRTSGQLLFVVALSERWRLSSQSGNQYIVMPVSIEYHRCSVKFTAREPLFLCDVSSKVRLGSTDLFEYNMLKQWRLLHRWLIGYQCSSMPVLSRLHGPILSILIGIQLVVPIKPLRIEWHVHLPVDLIVHLPMSQRAHWTIVQFE